MTIRCAAAERSVLIKKRKKEKRRKKEREKESLWIKLEAFPSQLTSGGLIITAC